MTDGKTPSFPHDCPSCGAPAYIGGPGMPAQCTNGHAKDGKPCPFFSEDNWIRWIMELPDPGDPEPEEESERPDSELTDAEWSAKHLDIDEEAITEPGIGSSTLGGQHTIVWPDSTKKILDELEKLIDEVPEPFVLTTGSDSTKIEV